MGAVHDPARHRVALARLERHRLAALDVDDEPAVHDEEELVLVVVAVPVEVALDHAEADDGVVDARERLVEPRLVRGRLGADVDELEEAELLVEADVVVARAAHARSYSRVGTDPTGAAQPLPSRAMPARIRLALFVTALLTLTAALGVALLDPPSPRGDARAHPPRPVRPRPADAARRARRRAARPAEHRRRVGRVRGRAAAGDPAAGLPPARPGRPARVAAPVPRARRDPHVHVHDVPRHLPADRDADPWRPRRRRPPRPDARGLRRPRRRHAGPRPRVPPAARAEPRPDALPPGHPRAAAADLEGVRHPAAGRRLRSLRLRAAHRPPRPPADRLPGAAARARGPRARHPAAAGRELSPAQRTVTASV